MSEISTIETAELHKELDLIQACITRMGHNSFMIKGLAFMLVTAFAALTAEKIDLRILCIVGIFIFLAFWYLDAFFLKMEQLYRFKYEWVLANRRRANIYNKQGDYFKALEFYEKALYICKEVFGEKHPDAAILQDNITAIKDLLYS